MSEQELSFAEWKVETERLVEATAMSIRLSLRDYFAGQALTAVAKLLRREPEDAGIDGARLVAQAAYTLADAMLAERAKEK